MVPNQKKKCRYCKRLFLPDVTFQKIMEVNDYISKKLVSDIQPFRKISVIESGVCF